MVSSGICLAADACLNMFQLLCNENKTYIYIYRRLSKTFHLTAIEDVLVTLLSLVFSDFHDIKCVLSNNNIYFMVSLKY